MNTGKYLCTFNCKSKNSETGYKLKFTEKGGLGK
jgi:hypothetical protein